MHDVCCWKFDWLNTICLEGSKLIPMLDECSEEFEMANWWIDWLSLHGVMRVKF